MTKIIELRPKKDLINTKFEKYQFSTDLIPITCEISLKNDVYRLELNSNQESLLEARLFAFHNHLFNNPYDESCWFIDEKWIAWRFGNNGSLDEICCIHNSNTETTNLLYNPSIGFTNNNILVISDGGSCLKLLIMDIQNSTKMFELKNEEAGVILDVQYVEETSTIIIAICAVTSNGDKKSTRLILLFYVWKDPGGTAEEFEFQHKEALRVQGAIEYVHIENKGKYLNSICQDHIMFENPKTKELENNTVSSSKEADIKIPKYCWSQDEDSITVWITVEKEDQKKVKVDVNATDLSVLLDDKVLMKGECQHRLDETLTTWKCEKDTFRLELVKYESGLMWNELIKGDIGGECLPNEVLAAEIHSRLAHLCTDQTDSKLEGQPCIGFNAEQLEECDLEGKDNILQRINLATQEITHMTMLSANNHVLFTHKTKFGHAMCLRHDHDGCVWISGQGNDDEWDMDHIGTFPGFGYVEASKSNKKFCVSPANGSYVAILEHTRHIFLYEKPKSDAPISKQWIVDLSSEIYPTMGAVATNQHLIVLTKNKLYRLQIYP